MAHAFAQRHSAPGERDASPGRAHAAAADRARSAQGEMSRAFALTSTWRAPVIHRACACGGGSNGNEEEEPIKRAPDASGLVSQPTDPAEIEADRIADQIMRMEDGTGDAIALAPPSPVARKCAACAAEEDTEEQVESLVSRATGGGGNPLDVSTRGRMESHFGRSFEDVRVHTSGAAAEMTLKPAPHCPGCSF